MFYQIFYSILSYLSRDFIFCHFTMFYHQFRVHGWLNSCTTFVQTYPIIKGTIIKGTTIHQKLFMTKEILSQMKQSCTDTTTITLIYTQCLRERQLRERWMWERQILDNSKLYVLYEWHNDTMIYNTVKCNMQRTTDTV